MAGLPAERATVCRSEGSLRSPVSDLEHKNRLGASWGSLEERIDQKGAPLDLCLRRPAEQLEPPIGPSPEVLGEKSHCRVAIGEIEVAEKARPFFLDGKQRNRIQDFSAHLRRGEKSTRGCVARDLIIKLRAHFTHTVLVDAEGLRNAEKVFTEPIELSSGDRFGLSLESSRVHKATSGRELNPDPFIHQPVEEVNE